jgi:predicted RNA-binding protein YlqC (UPF0109 family)
MEELVRTIARSLVDNPDAVDVKLVEKGREYIIELRVAEEDMGKVIGRQGRIAKAIRSVVKAVAVREHKHVNVEILD